MKKIIAMLLMGAMVVSIMGGCSSKDKTATTGNGEEGSSTTSQFNEEGYPIVNKPITIKAIFNSHPNTLEFAEMESFKELAKKTNINLDVEYVRSGWAEKKNLVLASGDLPDIFFGAGLDDSDLLNNKSYFVNLVPYIEKYAPNIQKMFKEEPTTKKICTVPDTGEIYGLPNVRPFRPAVGDSWFINKTWVENVGLEMPTTLDEFKEVLRAFKEKDANNNGDPNDEIPFNFDTSGNHFTWKSYIFGAYGLTSDKFGDKAQVRNDEVQLTPVQEEYKLAVSFMRDLYAEGLIYPEAFTQTNYMATGKSAESAQLGVGVHWQAQNLFGPYSDQYEVLKPLVGPEGHQQVTQNPDHIRLNKNTFSMTVFNKHPEATVRWLNELYGEEMSLQLFFGSIGPAIEKTDNGYKVLEPPTESGLSAGAWKWTMAPADRAPLYCSKELEAKTVIPDFHHKKLDYDSEVIDYVEPVENAFPMVIWPSDTSQELAMLKNDIFTFIDTKTAEWIVNGGIEDEWDDYLEQINAMGGDRLLEIYQQAYDKYNGVK